MHCFINTRSQVLLFHLLSCRCNINLCTFVFACNSKINSNNQCKMFSNSLLRAYFIAFPQFSGIYICHVFYRVITSIIVKAHLCPWIRNQRNLQIVERAYFFTLASDIAWNIEKCLALDKFPYKAVVPLVYRLVPICRYCDIKACAWRLLLWHKGLRLKVVTVAYRPSPDSCYCSIRTCASVSLLWHTGMCLIVVTAAHAPAPDGCYCGTQACPWWLLLRHTGLRLMVVTAAHRPVPDGCYCGTQACAWWLLLRHTGLRLMVVTGAYRSYIWWREGWLYSAF